MKGQYVPSQPKTEAGVRDVHIPPFLMADVLNHLGSFIDQSAEAPMFPARNGQNLHSSTFARHFPKAATAAGRTDATPHFLRHTGASLATSAGATTADVMARLGHTTPTMAMVYQHSLDGADARVADALSELGTERANTPDPSSTRSRGKADAAPTSACALLPPRDTASLERYFGESGSALSVEPLAPDDLKRLPSCHYRKVARIVTAAAGETFVVRA